MRKRNVHIQFWLDKKEAETLKKKAKRSGISSTAYVRHLIHAQEMLGLEILSIHNLAFYLWLVGEARQHILAGDFKTWKDDMMKRIATRL